MTHQTSHFQIRKILNLAVVLTSCYLAYFLSGFAFITSCNRIMSIFTCTLPRQVEKMLSFFLCLFDAKLLNSLFCNLNFSRYDYRNPFFGVSELSFISHEVLCYKIYSNLEDYYRYNNYVFCNRVGCS